MYQLNNMLAPDVVFVFNYTSCKLFYDAKK